MNIGPNMRNAIRAGIGNDVNVAAIKASDELHKVKIPAITIMATTDRIGLDAKGKIICWSTAVLKTDATAAPIMK